MDNLMLLPVKERNKAYQALSPRGKAKAIAQDILLQLDALRYKATPGIYFSAEVHNYTGSMRSSAQLQPVLEDSTVTCEVCARGAAFASAVRLGNACTIGSDNDRTLSVDINRQDEKVAEAFTQAEYLAMECVFEGSKGLAYHTKWTYEESLEYDVIYTRFRYKYFRTTDAKLLLRRVAQNILDNDGEFVIPGIALAPDKK